MKDINSDALNAVIERAGAIYEGYKPLALIARADKVGLADFATDMTVRELVTDEDLADVYFMFACFVLLALGEEL